MRIVYASMTGNVKRFVDRLDTSKLPFRIQKGQVISLNEPFILITYTTGFGNVPIEVDEFLRYNHRHLVAVIGSGNRNWGANFNKASKDIARVYKVPLLHEFELSGLDEDIEIVASKIKNIEEGMITFGKVD